MIIKNFLEISVTNEANKEMKNNKPCVWCKYYGGRLVALCQSCRKKKSEDNLNRRYETRFY